MLLLKATERNWGLIWPGDWEIRTWKINAYGTYLRKTRYRPVDPVDTDVPEDTEEGALSPEQMEALQECIGEYWTEEEADACDGSAWEFKLYENDTVIRHRQPGYICGLRPFEGIAALLAEEEQERELSGSASE